MHGRPEGRHYVGRDSGCRLWGLDSGLTGLTTPVRSDPVRSDGPSLTEVVHPRSHAVHHRQEEIAHRRFPAIDHTPAGLDEVAASPGDERRQIVMRVSIPVRSPAPYTIIELSRIDPSPSCADFSFVTHSRTAPSGTIDLRDLVHHLAHVPVVRERVMAVGDANLAICA